MYRGGGHLRALPAGVGFQICIAFRDGWTSRIRKFTAQSIDRTELTSFGFKGVCETGHGLAVGKKPAVRVLGAGAYTVSPKPGSCLL